MKNSDLVEILEALDEGEQKGLLLFLSQTPKARKECILIVEYLLAHINKQAWEGIQKINVYKQVFPNKPWVENKLAKLTGEALSLVRKFVAINTAQTHMSELQQLHYLQMFYQERKLDNKFWATRQKINESAGHLKWQTPSDFHLRFQSENQALILNSIYNKRKDDLNLINAIKALDEYYLIERQYLICHLLNQSLVAPINLTTFESFLTSYIKIEESKWFFEQPLGQIFLKVTPLLSKSITYSARELMDFIAFLREQESKIHPDFINLFELIASNYCIRKLNEGENVYLKILFENHQYRVKTGRIYIEGGMISPSEFLNIITLALRLQEFDWAKNFIETHKKKVLGVMPSQQYYEFALANCLFYTKDYQETCRILMTSDFADIQCIITGRILEIKALAEQFYRENADHRVGEYLEDRVEAAILFFFRHKDLEASKKKMGKRFADTMKRIIHAEGKRDVQRLEIILQDIQKAEFIAERQWLTKLVEDLIAKHKKK